MHAWQSCRNGIEIGHGIFRVELGSDVGRVLFHTGSVMGYSACFWWAEDGDCVVAALCNVGTVHAGNVLGAFSLTLGKSPAHHEFPRLAMRLASEDIGR